MSPNESNPENQNPSSGTFVSGLLFIWDFLKIVIIALAIIVPIRYFIFQPFIVSGSSMEPNFQNGQYLVIDELTYHFGNPSRGQVVVLRYPKDPKQFFIKRVIGLPHERVEIDNGKVIIFSPGNPEGAPLDESYLSNQGLTFPHDAAVVGGKNVLTIGDDEYFVMGDNRLASSDSRDWGVLKRSNIIGKVFLRALPLNEFEVYTKTPAYSF
ncbi:MAG: signal peptidase I [Candidatus Doudnabacteria bacterium RIFCSPLOWO2_02_FULL_49_13]|uniref:Signal peptidase I n=1 Tax=Candidatus Doudnabacteria bacterium RIFCSPHIGHO2_12_FULL_48_16 TaxID=1817838 RepID=A0A1F5PKI1_9BACT|nr:MAG: signal peptidase I [Candidatus Doudnabacteria bacterium RIFCSPHIGHO2_02_FULL_49_24]OGE89938.1 MAG: signal peptidase I [Candidatus Doudnabacteria bacterium RIFCSPHIGHO2_01_FULL_50_67]OGE90200.1 MAG: signal peptidase I [Candidatus Doudnabacteria bacterium RIFCSPHIGHO2_12_FULL_48_16]OGE97741.1 MAG: signal peptidase I [Candidatus Doudnabacteria bacterium RIFCSPLOWO2_01_FULL_49_40]OGF02878.1 MAG: signal peptidase I [Candidatus Doudnabacteria bacterium RIFCSPLOWO2_12_FULL_49_8]OGF03343.1 MAG